MTSPDTDNYPLFFPVKFPDRIYRVFCVCGYAGATDRYPSFLCIIPGA
jgi:hypothetical protein